jgi:predicted CXXCH cytochrome family protein
MAKSPHGHRLSGGLGGLVRYARAVRIAPVFALLVLGAGCRGPVAGVSAGVGQAKETRSNVLRTDYVGSAACAACHADVYAKWSTSPMRKMTRDPGQAEIRAPFAGETFTFKGDQASLFREGSARFMRMVSREEGEHLYRVTRVIGNHYREDFAGVEVDSTATVVQRGVVPELILPVTYYFQTQGYRPKGYSVMTHERPGLHAGGVWNQTCIFCHNTVPWLDTLLGALAGPSPPGYQGVFVDRLLSPERRFTYRVTNEAAFRTAVAEEEAFLGATPTSPASGHQDAARAGIRALSSRFQGQHLVEEGIGCEACHGGGREHATDPHVRTSFASRSEFLAIGPTAGPPPTRALLINRTCARCHQVLFSRYPFTWEGGFRHDPAPGGSSGTSGEARDFLLGGPGRNMACTVCHDPHALDKPGHLAELATPAGNRVCLTCHTSLANAEALADHAHHLPGGPAGSCIACHMPRKNMALDYALTRYHRIGSPTDRERVEGDRPLECALCHADKSVAALVGDMERLWGKHYDRAKLRALYGDLEGNALLLTLEHGRPHEQVTAAMVLAEHKVTSAAPQVARLLTSPYPLARRFAAQALAALLGQPCAIEVDASAADIKQALARCGLLLLDPPTSAPTGRPKGEPGDED